MLPQLPADDQLVMNTPRLVLEPILESHAQEMCSLFADPELHQYVPYEPLSIERQVATCERWAKRISPTGDELWLNWAARLRESGKVIGHFQAGLGGGHVASIGYLIARDHQKRGYATEGLEAMIQLLRTSFGVREVKAWIDSRNEASIRLVKKLGLHQVGFIRGADFFKGSSSDEFVFSLQWP